MKPTTVILITGHPATGKTTLAHYLAQGLGLPLLWRDGLKEKLADTLGGSTDEWSLKLSIASWELLYHLVETLLRAHISHMVESNFTPIYATPHWQALCERYSLQMIQLRCHVPPETVITRYHERIKQGQRHPIHRFVSDDVNYTALLQRGPMDWVDVPSTRLSIDTSGNIDTNYPAIIEQLRKVLAS